MTWSRRFRISEHLKGSLWIVPLMGAVLGAITGLLLTEADRHLNMPIYRSPGATCVKTQRSLRYQRVAVPAGQSSMMPTVR